VIRALHCAPFLFLLALAAAPASSQVTVNVSRNQPDYLAGEPIFVTVAFTNIGAEPLGYPTCDGRVDLTVIGAEPEQPPRLRGCFVSGGFGPGASCGVDHPPLMPPGQTVSVPYLLTGYRLHSGSYVLHASGRAAVRWFFGAGLNSSPVSRRKPGDPVEGSAFEVSLSLKIRAGTEEELRQRCLQYVSDSEPAGNITANAREAIAEMAPPFLEKTILGFATQPENESPLQRSEQAASEERTPLRLFNRFPAAPVGSYTQMSTRSVT
jgi:hypothetical protein